MERVGLLSRKSPRTHGRKKTLKKTPRIESCPPLAPKHANLKIFLMQVHFFECVIHARPCLQPQTQVRIARGG